MLNTLLNEAAKYSQKPILYSALDIYFLFLSRFRKELDERCLFAIPREEVAERLGSKRAQYELAQQLGIPHAPHHAPMDLDDVAGIKNVIEYPAFVKPYYPHRWLERIQNKGFMVNNPDDLMDKYTLIFSANLQAVVQSIIPGPDSNIFEAYVYMSEASEPLAAFVARKLRQYPTNFGNCTCMVSDHNSEVLSLATDIFRRSQYIGLGSVEIKKDEGDGSYKLIEINPRLGMQHMHATHAGINFPLTQYKHLTEGFIPPAKDYRDGVKWLDALPDFLAFCQLCRRGQLTPYSWLKSISDVKCHAFFARDDVKPVLNEYRVKFGRMVPLMFRAYSTLRG